MDITKPTALFSTKIIISMLSVILVVGVFVKCGTPATEVEEENGVEEVFAHEKELEEMGLAAPQVSYIVHKLKAKGLEIETDAITITEAARDILKALEGRKKG